jgi:SAM-dependent methyltransferase
MNQGHLDFLASPEWAQMLETDLLPWLVDVVDLAGDVLEIGPGPGLTTDLLRSRTERVTAVELDDRLAAALQDRFAGTNVAIIHGDATATGLDAGSFGIATCFSMLHHMPSPDDQDRLFAEVARVLRPGGMFVGVDSLDLDIIRAGHTDDIFVPVPPDTLVPRLESAGFEAATVDVGDYQMRFHARKPAAVPAT